MKTIYSLLAACMLVLLPACEESETPQSVPLHFTMESRAEGSTTYRMMLYTADGTTFLKSGTYADTGNGLQPYALNDDGSINKQDNDAALRGLYDTNYQLYVASPGKMPNSDQSFTYKLSEKFLISELESITVAPYEEVTIRLQNHLKDARAKVSVTFTPAADMFAYTITDLILTGTGDTDDAEIKFNPLTRQFALTATETTGRSITEGSEVYVPAANYVPATGATQALGISFSLNVKPLLEEYHTQEITMQLSSATLSELQPMYSYQFKITVHPRRLDATLTVAPWKDESISDEIGGNEKKELTLGTWTIESWVTSTGEEQTIEGTK